LENLVQQERIKPDDKKDVRNVVRKTELKKMKVLEDPQYKEKN
jgi:hypothetical protein